jgi:hypothetical protein
MKNRDLDLFKMVNADLDLDDLTLSEAPEGGEEEDGGYYPMLVIAE